MRILLLGGSGFIGSHVLSSLRQFPKRFLLQTASLKSKTDFNFDLTDYKVMNEFLMSNEFDIIVNATGKIHLEDKLQTPSTVMAVNTIGVRNLIKLCAKMSHKPYLIHLASALELFDHRKNFESSYALEKKEGTDAFMNSLKRREIRGICLRLHNVYGPNQPNDRFVSSTISNLMNGQVVKIDYPKRIRDFVFVHDVAYKITEVINEIGKHDVKFDYSYEIGTGVGVTIKNAGESIARIMGLVPEQVVLSSQPIKPDQMPKIVANIQKVFRNPCKTNFEEGIRKMLLERS